MRLQLTENIKETINIEREKFVSNLKFYISDRFQLFPDQMLSGKIVNNKLNARINPLGGWVDPFKSVVTGEIDKGFNTTILNLKVRPNWTIKVFLIIWYLISLLMIVNFDYYDLVSILKFIGLEIILIVFPLILVRMKVKWDKKRLERIIKAIC